MIRLENITKIYNEKVDDTKALDDVSIILMILRLQRQAVHRYISCVRKRSGMCSSILH